MTAFVIMGVSGCGKSSVGEAVAKELGAQFVDGDDLHPSANVEKMSKGIALNDEDRAPWLHDVGDALRGNSCVVIGCSALKKSYREIIRNAARREVVFLHCAGARSVIEARMAAREGHFMPVSLLDSQYGALQPLEPEEVGITVDIDQPFLVVVAAFLREIKERDYG